MSSITQHSAWHIIDAQSMLLLSFSLHISLALLQALDQLGHENINNVPGGRVS